MLQTAASIQGNDTEEARHDETPLEEGEVKANDGDDNNCPERVAAHLEIARRIPPHWLPLFDPADSKITWNHTNTFVAKLFGPIRAHSVTTFLMGSPRRMFMWYTLFSCFAVLMFLGLFKVIPREVMITVAFLTCSWTFTTGCCLFDLEIVRRVVLRDAFFVANVWLAVLAAVSYARILDWDYRGISLIPANLIVMMAVSVLDAVPFHLRAALAPVILSVAVSVLVNLILVNLGVFPDQSHSAMLYTLEGVGNLSLSVPAYGVFNDSAVALLLLNLNELRLRWPNRKRGTLRTVMAWVEGKDAPGGVDFAWVERHAF